MVIDHSSNCNSYDYFAGGGPALAVQLGTSIWLGNNVWNHARFLSRIQFYTYDTINGYNLHREAFRTTPYLYSSSHNYDDCSANFEYSITSQDSTGQRILFKAMNTTASYYQWAIIGFGNAILSNNDTVSQFYPYYPFPSSDIWLVGLRTIGSSGCRDTLWQQILVRNNIQTTASVNEIKSSMQYNFFPNPFNGQTILKVSDSAVNPTFSLFNSLGQLIQTNKIMDEQVIIHRNYLPSGIYYYIIQTSDKIIAKGKLIAE
jgi:hypothetical protein